MKLKALTAVIAWTVLSLVAVCAGERTRPGFTNMTQVVDFLAQCVNKNDLARFTNACVEPRNSTQMHSNVFLGLMRVHAAKPLKEIYAGREFPTNTSSFLMGGHNKELGFNNIPLLKTNGAWYIVDYFYCR